MNEFAVDHHLNQCATAAGVFAVLAIDHRDNLVEDLSKARERGVRARDVIAFKASVMRGLAGVSSAVLTDPDYGFPALVGSAVAARFGLLAPLEVTDYSVHPRNREPVFIEDWGVGKIKRSGCSGVKLLITYHPDAPNAASRTELVDRTVEQCRHHAIPLFLEPIPYALDPEVPLSDEERTRVVVETARHFSVRGVDVLKIPFPVTPTADEALWEPALAALNDACTVPWALLSAGVPFDLFLRQTAAACRAGASGVMVGRAVWSDAAALRGDALDAFMRTTARTRMLALASVCDLYGTPWHARAKRPKLAENWYR